METKFNYTLSPSCYLKRLFNPTVACNDGKQKSGFNRLICTRSSTLSVRCTCSNHSYGYLNPLEVPLNLTVVTKTSWGHGEDLKPTIVDSPDTTTQQVQKQNSNRLKTWTMKESKQTIAGVFTTTHHGLKLKAGLCRRYFSFNRDLTVNSDANYFPCTN